jgi:hypothetical protein
MADMLAPLNWDMPRTKRPPADTPTGRRPAANVAKEKASREPFKWPTPPFASYPAPSEQTETLP